MTKKEASKMNYTLVCYPLSIQYRSELEQEIGCVPEYIKLSELRHLPLPQIFRKLRSVKADTLFLAFEDANSYTLISVLGILAAIIPSKKRIIATPELELKPRGRFQAIIEIMKLVVASLHGQYSLYKAGWELNQLLKMPRFQIKTLSTQRILYLKANLWYGSKVGGSVGHVAGVVNGFNRLGCKVDLITAVPPVMLDPEIAFHQIQSLTAYSLPYETNVYRFNQSLEHQSFTMPLQQPDFIYQRFSIANYSGVLLSKKIKTPLVIEYNGSEVWIANNWGIPHRYQELAVKAEMVCLQHAHLIVVVAEALRDELISKEVDPNRILVYPNCIDPVVFNPERFTGPETNQVRSRHGISPDAIVATFIGTFGNWHGIERLAEAIHRMVDADESWLKEHRLHFLLIGDGVKMGTVREILAGEKYQLYYTLTGLVPQDKAPEYLAASDIFLSPHIPNPDGSRFFGSPTKLFEYMAMERGIVASDLEQIGEILKDSLRASVLPKAPPADETHELAVLCKPGDIGELISGIRFLTENTLWRKHLGMNARKEVLAKYTWNRHVSAILEKVKQLSGESKDETNLPKFKHR
jgi:glycosyltransferase involved in cell wall biosynthesis